MEATKQTANELVEHLKDDLKLLRTLRDEIRVDVHLAGMDAKARWAGLLSQFEKAEQMAREASETSRRAVDDALKAFRDFRKSVGQHPAAAKRA